MSDSKPGVQEGADGPFVDVAAILSGGAPQPPQPTFLRRKDGHCLFYAGKVNVLFGDPECGKSWIAYAAVEEAIRNGQRALVIDADHNGPQDILSRLVILGAKTSDLADPDLFRLAEPEDKEHMLWVIAEAKAWEPDLAVVDSVGEVLPMLGLSSNSPDDFTTANRRVLAALADVGAAVVAIDHQAKNDASRAFGQSGTMAKKRAINGVSIHVRLSQTFAPGKGGAASLLISKDRPGGVREHCPDMKPQPAGRFVMKPVGDGVEWFITDPQGAADVAQELGALDLDVAELDVLDPPPKSKTDVMSRMKWGTTRALRALEAWRQMHPEAGDKE